MTKINVGYIIGRKKNMKQNISTKKPKFKIKNNKYLFLKLNRRNASLILNSLALTRRYLYYKNTEDIPLELFFDKNNFNEDFFDLTLSIEKINEDCKNNFYNWNEFKVYKR